MALQIENGYPLLTIDLGSGPEQLINNKYVSDNTWYQAIIDRYDKHQLYDKLKFDTRAVCAYTMPQKRRLGC